MPAWLGGLSRSSKPALVKSDHLAPHVRVAEEAVDVHGRGKGSNAKSAAAVVAAAEIHGKTADLVEMADASAAVMMTAAVAVVVDVTSTLMAGSDLLPPTKT